jgi:hypothetical protein
VCAVGDVRHRSVKRVASSVGEGAVAIQLVSRYLDSQRGGRTHGEVLQAAVARQDAEDARARSAAQRVGQLALEVLGPEGLP